MIRLQKDTYGRGFNLESAILASGKRQASWDCETVYAQLSPHPARSYQVSK